MNGLTEKIIGAAIDVHKALGPGLLESAFEECLAHEFFLANISFERQVPLPVTYKLFGSTAGIASISWLKKGGLGTKSRGRVATDP